MVCTIVAYLYFVSVCEECPDIIAIIVIFSDLAAVLRFSFLQNLFPILVFISTRVLPDVGIDMLGKRLVVTPKAIRG